MATITYCDLCMVPLKENDYYIMFISEPRNSNFETIEEFIEYKKQVENGMKEICPQCKYVFDKMFELRLQKLSELADEINFNYNLPSRKNPNERKNKKEKQ